RLPPPPAGELGPAPDGQGPQPVGLDRAVDDDRLESQRAELGEQEGESRLVLAAAGFGLTAAGAPIVLSPGSGLREGDDERVNEREALLPDRVLDDDGNDVPPVCQAASPPLRCRRREVVGADE